MSVSNQTGVSFNNASLRLVSGDVNRVTQDVQARGDMMMARAVSFKMESAPVNLVAGSDYYVYELSRPTTLMNQHTKQILFYEARDIRVEKKYVIQGNQSFMYSMRGQETKTPVFIYIHFKNKDENH